VLTRPALERLARRVPATGARLGQPEEAVAKMTAQFADAHLAVVVVAAPKAVREDPRSSRRCRRARSASRF
jgi:hypothetical protein